MFDRVVLARDLVDAGGVTLAPRGLVVSLEAVLARAAGARPEAARARLGESRLAADVAAPLEDVRYAQLFREGARGDVERTLRAVALPASLLRELERMQLDDPARWRHAVTTAAVAARMVLAALGDAPALPDLAAAGLLHDLGMRHVAAHLAANDDPLDAGEIGEVAAHPLLGGLHLAAVLGPHPAVEAALWHHWRNGQGYPAFTRAPKRAVEVVSVASAFAALTQDRSFRAGRYDVRGAVDVLVDEASEGRFDLTTVRLLVHALRGGVGQVRDVELGRERLGHAPRDNRYTPIARRRGQAGG